jgi:hypothetical protein
MGTVWDNADSLELKSPTLLGSEINFCARDAESPCERGCRLDI